MPFRNGLPVPEGERVSVSPVGRISRRRSLPIGQAPKSADYAALIRSHAGGRNARLNPELRR